MRAVAVACLPSLPAPMLAEVVAAVAPSERPSPEHALPNVTPADANRLARLLAVLALDGTNLPPGVAAARLASAGAARIGDGGNPAVAG